MMKPVAENQKTWALSLDRSINSNPSMETGTLDENTKIHKSLPQTLSIEEIEASISIVKTSNSQDQNRIEEILLNQAVPEDTTFLFEVENNFEMSDDELIVRASDLVSGDAHAQMKCNLDNPDFEIGGNCPESNKLRINSEVKKLSLMNMAAIIEENCAKSEVKALDLQAKLMEQVEWIPLSIGKLFNLVELNLADNHIMALPSTITSLKVLERLDFHSNQIINLPGSFGELSSLTRLDLHANRLRTLPSSFGNLIYLMDLDLSSNRFVYVPDVIGDLRTLKRLNVENNELEEVTYTIGSCSLLVELRLDFNRLKSLPEAIENLRCLEILTLRYNRIKQLPITIGKLLQLKELDVSFNELEELPQSLCFATNLKKLNVGKNFVDLQGLPDSIGNLEMLEELDISDNQIRNLPDSFRFLVNLKVLHADIDLLQIPPSHIADLGAKAIVQYMDDFVDKKNLIKTRGLCFLFGCCFGVDI